MPFRHSNQTTVPFRRRATRRRPRRSYRSGFTRGRTAWNPRVPAHVGQPNTMKVKLRYAINDGDLLEIASSTGSIIDYTFRANDCYDPYQSGAGHQPLCFDQWMALYKRGIVLGSRIVVRFFLGTGSATAKAMRCYIVRKNATAAPTTNEITEGRAGVSKILTAEHDIVQCNKTYSYKMECRDPFDQDELEFTNAATPTKQHYFHVGGYALNAQTQTCVVTGFIEYICMLSDPINPASS